MTLRLARIPYSDRELFISSQINEEEFGNNRELLLQIISPDLHPLSFYCKGYEHFFYYGMVSKPLESDDFTDMFVLQHITYGEWQIIRMRYHL